MSISRRDFLRGTAASAAFGAAAGGLGLHLPLARAAGIQASWANLSPGFTILVTEYMAAKKLDERNGLALGKPTNYTSVSTYYQDFVAGSFDICIGTWDTFAARYLAGVPIQL